MKRLGGLRLAGVWGLALIMGLLWSANGQAAKLTKVSLDPSSNNNVVANDASISIVYDYTVSSASVTQSTYPIWGSNHGLLSGSPQSVGDNATFVVNQGFTYFPGELITATATTGIVSQATSEGADYPTTWIFRVKTLGGSLLHDSGLTYGSNSKSQKVALADLDQDGDLDAVVANEDGDNEIWLNMLIESGSLNFELVQSLGATNSYDLSLADLNNDGYADIFFANNGVNKAWINPGSHFRAQAHLVSVAASSLVDGDFFTLGDAQATAVFEFDLAGDGVVTGRYPVVIDASADLDGNGSVDKEEVSRAIVKAVNAVGDALRVTAGMDTPDNPDEVKLQRDLWDGLALTTSENVTNANFDITSSGSGTASQFSAITQTLPSSSSTGVASGDLDGDGDLDLVVSNESDTPRIYWNDGNGNFITEDFSTDPSADNITSTYDVAIGDLTNSDFDYCSTNGDDKMDLVFATNASTDNRSLAVFYQDEHGNFIDFPENYGTQAWVRSISLGDVNGDGFLDVVAGQIGAQKANTVWRNKGRSSSTCKWSGLENTQQALYNKDTYDIALGDLDGDGDLDAVAVNSTGSSSPEPNEFWINDGTGYFSGPNPTQEFGNSVSRGVALGDLDNDGDLDVFEANIGTFPDNNIWLNNTLPQVQTNNGLTTAENSSHVLLASELAASDIDDDDDTLRFVLTQTPVNGELSLLGSTLGQGGVFTQGDINNGYVVYSHNGSETTTDQFKFKVEDLNGGSTGEDSFEITITAINDTPIVDVNTGATVSEGNSITLGNAQLRATDADDDDLTLLYTVTAAPAHGQVLKQGTVTTSFTQDDINNNRISYSHDGGESTSDSFSFTVEDDGGAVTGTKIFNLSITAVNDAPTVTTNLGLLGSNAVDEGSSATLSSTVLLAEDVDDTDPNTLTYTIIQLPVNGILKNGAATLGTNGTFTQGDINTSKVTYTHDGSETTSDSFRFVVKDPSNAQAPAQTFSIQINPVNDMPLVVVNTGLGVAEGGSATIGSGRLQSTDADDVDADLIYTLTVVPVNGELQKLGVAMAVTDTFTQADIDSNSISYQHDNSQTTSDSFRFTVSDGNLTTSEQSFAITVSSVNNPPTVDINAGATVAEDSTVQIDNTKLSSSDPDTNDGPAQLSYKISQAPINGTLTNGVTALGVGGIFTQADIDNNNISYTHDGSETTADSFQFVVTDSGNLSAPAETFSITVTPVNDAPQVIVNARVGLNEGDTVTVGSSVLQSTDADDADSGLVYEATIIPAHGELRLNDIAIVVNGTFTQDDINTGKLTYAHDGGESTADSFSFTVSDGTDTTVAQAFSFDVTPVNDAPQVIHNTGLSLNEGATQGITNIMLAATDVDNADSSLLFRLTQAPVNGTLLNGVNIIKLNDNFSQADIDSGKISYAHSGSETTADSFRVVVSDAQNAQAPAATFLITIIPVNDSPVIEANLGLTVDEDQGGTISNSRLRASDVDNIDQDLVYTLAQAPANGSLLNGVTPLTTNSTFTQGDINSNALTYQHNGSETTGDSFKFTVSDGSATTSQAIFAIVVNPVNDAPSLGGNHSNVAVDEGANLVVTNGMLNATDPDDNDTELLYTLTAIPTHGSVLNGVNSMGLNAKFTQSNINSGSISYQHDGSETSSDSFQVRVTDPSGAAAPTATFSLVINPVNDSPVIAVNTGLTVLQGASSGIGNGRLQATDSDNNNDELVFTLTQIPVNGELQLGGVPLALNGTFTQTQIDAGALSYQHDNSETTADSFKYTVSDGSASTAETLFPITISDTNNAPSISVNTGLTLDEAAQSIIANSMLAATDPDDNDWELNYTLTALPLHGQIRNGVTALTRNAVFSQNDIDTGKISYVHDGSESTADSFQVIVKDPSGQSSAAETFSITINPVNDLPVILTNRGLSLDEGQSVTLGSSLLVATDAEDLDSSLNFVIDGLPNYGTLTLSGANLNIGGSFSQSALGNGFVDYHHDGSENFLDSFSFHVADSDGGQSPLDVFTISINSVNDAPVVDTNLGATLDEGSDVVISDSMLSSSDADDGATTLIYSILQIPSHGELRNGVTTLHAGNSFTQGDINIGNIRYVHDGSETTLDSFQFSVRDPHGASAPSQTFALTITAVNDAPVVEANMGLSLDEGMSQTIDNSLLRASDVDSTTVTFALTAAPSHGDLNLAGTLLAAGDTFTQAQINGNSLSYQHSGDEVTADNFRFTVSDGNTTLLEQVFPITINAINDAPEFLINSGLTVIEAGNGVIHNTQLAASDVDNDDASLIFTLVEAPAHGSLSIGLTELNSGETFYQADIDAGDLSYQHDGSQTTSDSFRVSVSDGSTSAPAVIFNITISATNNPPSIVANTGFSLDEGADIVIDNSMLSATDADNDDASLLYTLTLVPQHGTLYNYTVPLQVGDSFSQGHIDSLRIHYVHDAGESSQDQFQFNLSDNSGVPVGPSDVLITINPVNDLPQLVSNSGLTLNEGSTAALTGLLEYSDAEQVATDISYEIVQLPISGDLMLGAATELRLGDSFTQAQINQGVVNYRHNGGELPSDSFSFVVKDGIGETSMALFLISVSPVNDTPIVERHELLYVTEGYSETIDNGTLRSGDADDDNATLRYTLTRLPIHGELRLNGVALGLNGQFTQGDINSLSVIYLHDGGESSSDNFGFTVQDTAGATASAESLMISIRPVNDKPVLVLNTGTNVQAGTFVTIDNNMLRATDSDNDDADLSYVITRTPAHGRLRKNVTNIQVNGVVLQRDIDSHQLVYVHNGDEGLNDSFAFILKDDYSQLPEASFAIAIGAVNDPPHIDVNTGLTIQEAASAQITDSMLSASDPDNDNASLIYTLSTAPAHGSLLLAGTALATNETFTQGDIVSGRVSYAHDGSEEATDSFRVLVSDPQGASSSLAVFEITVQAINDVPSLINNGISLNEGATVIISSSQLRAQDPDSDVASLIFTVSAIPEHGSILSGIAPLMVGNTFTQGIIDSGRLSYQHDGGESIADSFKFSVRDSGNAETEEQTFNMTIIPVNDAPEFATIAGQSIAADEAFSSFDLDDYVTDVDNSIDDMTYSASTSTVLNVVIGADNVVTVSAVDAEWTGTETITFTVNDGENEVSQDVDYQISAVPNQAPVWDDDVTPTDTLTIEAESELLFTVKADDPEGDEVLYTSADLPIGATLDSTTGEFSWTPIRQHIGTWTVTVHASDAEFSIDREITIDVIEPIVLDAGVVDSGPPEEPGGCGCSAQTQGSRVWLWGLLAGLGLIWRRRR